MSLGLNIYDYLVTYLLLQVSVMTKIVPSPDWFIGLDSVDLCKEGTFTQEISIEVRLRLACYNLNMGQS